MKRVICLITTLILSIALIACSNLDTNSIGNGTVPSNAKQTVPQTEVTQPANPTETLHIHNWLAATCTVPKTCSVCGETEGVSKGHAWKQATCDTPKTCNNCGAIEGNTKAHNWKDATYTLPKICTSCGETEGEPLVKPGSENYHGHVYTGGEYSKKFHYEAGCGGKNSHEITWDEVQKRELGPCGTCVLK